MKIKSGIILFLVFLLFFIKCDLFKTEEEEEQKSAKFEITSKQFGTTSYDCPYVRITVKNTGDATGYNASCDVKAKIGSTIHDTGFAYFADGGNIRPGESAVDDAIFFEIESFAGYVLEYELDWLTR